MLQIRTADSRDYSNIRDFYYSLIDAMGDELLVIHALGVNSMFSGKGIAKQMVQQVIKIAHENNIKTIRLDVLEGNIPAEKAYTKMGFIYLDTIQFL